ncbi:MAG: trigger factor [Patescibacteria group bacterium]
MRGRALFVGFEFFYASLRDVIGALILEYGGREYYLDEKGEIRYPPLIMQEPTINKLPQSLVELKFVVTPVEVQPYLDQAANDLQTQKPIQGFRPGKAPYDVVKQNFDEMKIWEAALERIVRARYTHTILENNIDAIGSPAINIDQLTPGQDMKFTITVPVMPTTISLASYDVPLVTKKVREIKNEEVAKALDDLRKMRRQEIVVDKPATKEDLVIIDLEMKKDHVAIEGGTAKGHRVYLSEQHYIPGFTDKLEGVKKGDIKTFKLSLPDEHYQKDLAGKEIEFTASVTDVYELKLPELDDKFASELGVDTLDKLREQVKKNMEEEVEHKADEAAEIELLETLIKQSKFSDMPELLVNEEVRRMFHELTHAAENQGMKMDDYLASLKKTADEIKLDMVPRAIERIQTAVLIKEIALKEDIKVEDEEVDKELDRILDAIKDKETKERVSSPEYRDYLAAQMKNRKTLEVLKKKGIKKAEEQKD